MDEPPRGLVTMSWVVKRTNLARSTVRRYAERGLIPLATKLGSVYRFDPDAVEAWIAASRLAPQATEPGEVCYPARPAPNADHRRGAAHQPAHPGAANLPPLMVIYPNAAHRGINDLPAETTARATASRRKGRTKKTALPR